MRAENHWPGPTAAKGTPPAVASAALPPETIVEIAAAGLPTWRARWADFRRDNEGADFEAIAATLARGETWRDGGGAAPAWSVRRVG